MEGEINLKVNDCKCKICQKREALKKNNPEKEIGMQYAFMKLSDEVSLLISSDELEYIYKESPAPTLALNRDTFEKKYTIAYGVFFSQKNWHEDFYDLGLSKGSEYFYLDSVNNKLKSVRIEDFLLVSKNESRAKVILLLSSEDCLIFPKSNSELAITLTKVMTELGTELTDLIFSRVEYGIFRLDKGFKISNTKIVEWKNKIDHSLLFDIDYDRFLLID